MGQPSLIPLHQLSEVVSRELTSAVLWNWVLDGFGGAEAVLFSPEFLEEGGVLVLCPFV